MKAGAMADSRQMGPPRRLAKDCLLRMMALVERSRLTGEAPRVFIPRIPRTLGGPRSFMQLLVRELAAMGWQVTHNRHVPASIALVPISWDVATLRRWKNEGRRIVQRLDGLFYDPETGVEAVDRNRETATIYRDLADGIIFQSEYSRIQCGHFLGAPGCKRTEVVINGTDTDVFGLSGRLPCEDGIWRMVSTGNFRDRSMVQPILWMLDRLWEERQDFRWELVGPLGYCGAEAVVDRPYLSWVGSASRAELAVRVSSADVFLFAFLNPNCPNSVIEATACGVPVVSFDSGSMRELCGFNADLLAAMPVTTVHVERDLNPEALFACLRRFMGEPGGYRERSVNARQGCSIQRAARAYDAFLRSLLP